MNNNNYRQLTISDFDDDSLLEIVLKHIERERLELDLFEKKVMSYKEKSKPSLEKNLQQTSKNSCHCSHKNSEHESSNSRKPKEMIISQYKYLSMNKIVELILNQTDNPIPVDELTRMIYDTSSREEFSKAKRSLKTTLCQGANDGLWKKLNKDYYQRIIYY